MAPSPRNTAGFKQPNQGVLQEVEDNHKPKGNRKRPSTNSILGSPGQEVENEFNSDMTAIPVKKVSATSRKSTPPLSLATPPIPTTASPASSRITTTGRYLRSRARKDQMIKQETEGALSRAEEEAKVRAAAALPKTSRVRSVPKSVFRDLNLGIYLEFISPLNLINAKAYPCNYTSFEIIGIQSGGYVDVEEGVLSSPPPEPEEEGVAVKPEQAVFQKKKIAVLKLVGRDLCTRFQTPHLKGIFDDATINVSFDRKWIILLLGSFAEVAAAKQPKLREIINLASFRTLTYPTNDDDSPACIIMVYREDDLQSKTNVHDPDFLANATSVDLSPMIRQCTALARKNTKSDLDSGVLRQEDPWIPLISFTPEWIVPEDPKTLNRSLHTAQPETVIDVNAFTSMTVKKSD